MNLKDYAVEVQRTSDMEPDLFKFAVLLGLAGEAGEVCDYMKKVLAHGHDLDESVLIKELGDVFWYAVAICNAFDLDPDEVLAANVQKLRARYPDGFSTEASKERRDVIIVEPPTASTESDLWLGKEFEWFDSKMLFGAAPSGLDTGLPSVYSVQFVDSNDRLALITLGRGFEVALVEKADVSSAGIIAYNLLIYRHLREMFGADLVPLKVKSWGDMLHVHYTTPQRAFCVIVDEELNMWAAERDKGEYMHLEEHPDGIYIDDFDMVTSKKFVTWIKSVGADHER